LFNLNKIFGLYKIKNTDTNGIDVSTKALDGTQKRVSLK